MDIRTEHLDEGAVFVITIDPEAEWHTSKFPTPLVTADYDRDGKLFQMVVVGAMAKHLSAAVKSTLHADLNELVDHEVIDDLDKVLVAAA
jgi:pyruvate/2-oxoglutarate/acetoin dehydrogenase E1 component